jgi:F-type H+-transporting ATPase subunit delta
MSKTAQHYAQALTDALRGSPEQLELTASELAAFAEAFAEQSELRDFFLNPTVASTAKVQLIRSTLQQKLSTETLNFLSLLAEGNAFGELPAVQAAVAVETDTALGRQTAVVESATPLSAEELAGIAAALERESGLQVRTINAVVPEVLGGVRIRLGDQLIDSSLAGQLGALRQSL